MNRRTWTLAAVANVSVPERLSDSRYTTLILRLLIDRAGEVLQGEVGGLVGDQPAPQWVRFRGSAGLLPAVRAWLADEHQATEPDA